MRGVSKVWADARDLDAVVAERLGLIGEQETWRRARAWGLVVLAILFVALLLSPVVAGGQPQPSQVATAVQQSTASTWLPLPPVALPDSYRTREDAPLVVPAKGVLANDHDPHGRPLQAQLRTPPQGGATVILQLDGSFTYTPAENFAGKDAFTYDVFDSTNPGRRVSGIFVTVEVLPINDPPVAVADVFVTPMGTALRVDPPGVLANDTDVETDPLRAELTSLPRHGTVTVLASGGLSYQPEAGFVGLDSFTYTASDGTNFSSPGQVTIEVTAVRPAPRANDDGYSTGVDEVLIVPAPGLLANDAGAGPDPLVARLDVDAEAGTVDVEPDGGFTYSPSPGFGGLDRFTYVASDGNADSTPATVTVVVGSAADAFALGEDAFTLAEDTTLAVAAPGVLANDGVEGTARQAELLRAPASGTVELGVDGSLIYVPDPDFTGEDSFEYVVVLGDAVSPPATVVLTVDPVEEPLPPTPPTTSPPPPTTSPPPTTGASSRNAAPPPPPTTPPPPPDADAAPSPDAAAPPAPSAEPPVNGDGGDGVGDDGGGDGGSAAGAPVGAVTIDVAGDLADQLGGVPVVSLKAPPPRGDVIVNPDGTVTYGPPPEFLGRDAFGYRACTLDQRCATGTVELVVAAGPEEGGAPEVRFQKVADEGGVSWPVVALALAALVFAVVMAVVVVRAVRGPADPFSGTDLQPADAASPGAPEI